MEQPSKAVVTGRHAAYFFGWDGTRISYGTLCVDVVRCCCLSHSHSTLSNPCRTADGKQKKKKGQKRDRISRRTQAGIGHSAPAHRDGHVQNRSRRREQRRGRHRTNPQVEQPRVDVRPSRKMEVRQHARGRGQPGACRNNCRPGHVAELLQYLIEVGQCCLTQEDVCRLSLRLSSCTWRKIHMRYSVGCSTNQHCLLNECEERSGRAWNRPSGLASGTLLSVATLQNLALLHA